MEFVSRLLAELEVRDAFAIPEIATAVAKAVFDAWQALISCLC
jgi:hypothetical protein